MSEAEQRRVRLTLHYDGAGFHGWQVQPGVRTVQSELETALERLTSGARRVAAAGRTDRGVHATGQVVTVDVPRRWAAAELRRALNAVLPRDVWVAAASEAAPDFHARFSAVARGYVYRVGLGDVAASPFRRPWCWPLRDEPDPGVLARLAAELPGDRSFAAFAKAGQEERGDRCTVLRSEWSAWRGGLQYAVVANRFLHHMVRYLVGTMVEAAAGRRPASDLRGLLAGEAGLLTSPPAPAEGLFLVRVYYPGEEPRAEERLDEDLP